MTDQERIQAARFGEQMHSAVVTALMDKLPPGRVKFLAGELSHYAEQLLLEEKARDGA